MSTFYTSVVRTTISSSLVAFLTVFVANAAFAQLSGSYTVGTVTSNFLTIQDAFTALQTQGVNGEVVMNVEAGNYDVNSLSIGNIPGSSSLNTVTIQALSGDVYWGENGSTVLSIVGTDYLRFERINFRNTYFYSILVSVEGQCNDLKFIDCKFDMPAQSGAYGLYAYGAESDNLTVQDCEFMNGGYAVYTYYGAGNTVDNVVYDSNIFTNQRYNALYLEGKYSGLRIEKNIISENGTNSSYRGIYCYGSSAIFDTKIENNTIQTQNGYGIWCYAPSTSTNVKIANNMVSSLGNSSSGMYLYSTTNTEVLHNSFLRNTINDYGAVVELDNINNCNIKNNIFADVSQTPKLVNYYGYQTSNVFDYNTYWSPTELIFYNYNNGTMTGFGTWQTANYDANGQVANPNFISNTNLHTLALSIDAKGEGGLSITTDFDGEARNATTPDPGADEFTPSAIDGAIAAVVLPTLPVQEGFQDIEIQFFNNGTSVINAGTVNFWVNGSPVFTSSFTADINSGESLNINMGAFEFETGVSYDLMWFISDVNGAADGASINDTLKINDLFTSLCGTYTVGEGGDFENFAQLNNVLDESGVSCPVVFDVAVGVYTDGLYLDHIMGASTVNTITFRGVSENPEDVVLQGNQTQQNTIYINETDGVQFERMRIQKSIVCCGQLVYLYNHAEQTQFDSCVFAVYNAYTAIEANGQMSGLSVKNSRFFGPSGNYDRVIYAYGYNDGSNYYSDGFVFENNLVENASYNALNLYYFQNVQIRNNVFTNDSYSSRQMYISDCKDIEVSGNVININEGSGIEVNYTNTSEGSRNRIFNNAISIVGSYINIGLNLSYSSNFDVFHNNIYTSNTNASSDPAFNMYYGSDNSVKNNIFVTESGMVAAYNFSGYNGGGEALTAASPAGDNNWDIDYNNYFTNGPVVFGVEDAVYGSLASYVAVADADANSFFLDPYFVSPTDLHISNVGLDAAGATGLNIEVDLAGVTRTSPPDLGAYEFTPPSYDPAITALISPVVPLTLGINPVTVNIYNNGVASITDLTFDWTVNGVTNTYTWSGNLVPASTETVTVGTYDFASNTPYEITVTVNSVGFDDANLSNNTVTATDIYTALCGNFTIGAVGQDFESITDAIDALYQGGISCPVVFDLVDETYFENTSFAGNIPGTSTINTITFDGANTANWSANYQNIYIENADYLHFNGIHFTGAPGYAVVEVSYNSVSHGLEITNCVLDLGAYSSYAFYSYEMKADSLVFKNNTINDGSYGIYIQQGNKINVLNIEDNLFNNQYYYSVYNYFSASKTNIVRNEMTSNVGPTNRIAVYLYQNAEALVAFNKISANIGTCLQIGASGNEEEGTYSKIYNNFFAISGLSGYDVVNANYMSRSKWWFNSFNTYGNVSSQALEMYSCYDTELKNNIFAHQNNGPCFGMYYPNIYDVSHNNFFTQGPVLAVVNYTNNADLSALQASGFGNNSITFNPLFPSSIDLHTSQNALNGLGISIPEITTDIDNQPRAATPDIGADEFLLDEIDLSLIAITQPNTGCSLSSSETIKVQIANVGSADLSDFDLHLNYFDANGTYTITKTFAGTLSAGASSIFDFEVAAALNTPSTYFFQVWSDIEGDVQVANDTVEKTIISYPTADISLTPQADTVCNGTQVTLLANGGNFYYASYQWSMSNSTYYLQTVAPTATTLYTVTITDVNNCTYSLTSLITVEQSPGVAGAVGDNQWNVSVYNSTNHTAYVGYYTSDSINFVSGNDWSEFQSPSNAPNYQGCEVGVDYFSIKAIRTGFVAGNYDILMQVDDQAALFINNTQVGTQSCCAGQPTLIWSGAIDETDTIELRGIEYYYVGSFKLILRPCVSSTQPISIVGNNDVLSCASTVLKTEGGSAGSSASLKWYTNACGGVSIGTGDSIIVSPDVTSTYYARYESSCETDAACVNFTINVSPTPAPVAEFGDFKWHVTAFETNANDYKGFYVDSATNFNTQSRFSSLGSPSQAPGYQGCTVPVDYFKLIAKRKGFVDANYAIVVTELDDALAIIVNGVTVYSAGCCYSGSPNNVVWTGALNSNSEVQIVYTEATSSAYTNVEFRFCTPLGSVTNMNPANASLNLNPVNLSFSWTPAGNADFYQFFIWKQGQTRPLTPYATTSSISTNLYLEYNKAYKWQIRAKNECFESWSDSLSFTTIGLPDLITKNVTVPDTVETGTPISVEWITQNIGDYSTGTASWYDYIYLSQDAVFDQFDTNMGYKANVSYLNPGQEYVSNFTFTVPNNVIGNYYVFVLANQPYASTPEFNYANNGSISNVMLINLAPLPDLKPVSIGTPTTVFGGDNVNVTYIIKNEGEVPATGYWRDRVYLSTSPNLVISNSILLSDVYEAHNLLQDSTYTKNVAVTIPVTISGTYWMHIYTDVFNQKYEGAYEDNNIGTTESSIQVILTPPADLRLTALSAPTAAASGQNLNVQFKVRNQGGGTTNVSSWKDKVFLSLDNSYSANDVLLGTFVRAGTLAAGSDYTVNQGFTVPNGLSGDYFIVVHTDADSAVFEYNLEGNNFRSTNNTVAIQLSPYPDLLPTEVTASVSSINASGYYTVGYKVKNIGTAPTSGQWAIRLFASTSPTWPGSGANIGTNFVIAPFNPGDSLSGTFNLTAPLTAQDLYYYIYADATGSQYEHDMEGNNVNQNGTYVQILPPLPSPSDLEAITFNSPASGLTGTVVLLSGTIRNNGPNASAPMTSGVYLSSNGTIDASDVLISLQNFGGYSSNSTFNFNGTYTLPNALVGNYFLIFKVDVNNQNVYESNLSNQIIVNPITITLTPPVDLVITSFNAPDTFIGGQSRFIPYTVQNQGIGTVSTSNIYDLAFLGNSPIVFNNYIGARYKIRALAPGESYTDSILVTIPNYITGFQYLNLSCDHYNGVYEHIAEDNNVASKLVTIIPAEAIDLLPLSITLPNDSLTLGDNVTLSYKFKNQGSVGVYGATKNNVHFSKDLTFSATQDPLFASQNSYFYLAPGDSISTTTSGVLKGTFPDTYSPLLRVNATGTFPELNLANNDLFGTPVLIEAELLPIDDPDTSYLNNTDFRYYKVTAEAEKDLLISLKQIQYYGANQIYVAYNRLPSAIDFDFFAADLTQTDQTALVPTTLAGDYYILCLNTSPGTFQQVEAEATYVPFSILSIDPNVVGQGVVSTVMTGGGFRDTAVVQLRDGNTVLSTATITHFFNSMKMEVQWDLSNVPLGTYDVVVVRGAETAVLVSGLTVEAALDLRISAIDLLPASVRVGRPSIWTFLFENTGNLDVPIGDAAVMFPNYVNVQNISLVGDAFTITKFVDTTSLPSSDIVHGDDLNAIPIVIGKLSPGEQVVLTFKASGYPAAFMPINVTAMAYPKDRFIRKQAFNIEKQRQSILADPALVNIDEVLVLATDKIAFRHELMMPYVIRGLLTLEDLDTYAAECNDCPNYYNFSPGASPGTQIESAVTINPGDSYLWEINLSYQQGGSAGLNPGWDLVKASGAVTINATPADPFVIYMLPKNFCNDNIDYLTTWEPWHDYRWPIMIADGGITGFAANKFSVYDNIFAGYNNLYGGAFSIEKSGDTLFLKFSATTPMAGQNGYNGGMGSCGFPGGNGGPAGPGATGGAGGAGGPMYIVPGVSVVVPGNGGNGGPGGPATGSPTGTPGPGGPGGNGGSYPGSGVGPAGPGTPGGNGGNGGPSGPANPGGPTAPPGPGGNGGNGSPGNGPNNPGGPGGNGGNGGNNPNGGENGPGGNGGNGGGSGPGAGPGGAPGFPGFPGGNPGNPGNPPGPTPPPPPPGPGNPGCNGGNSPQEVCETVFKVIKCGFSLGACALGIAGCTAAEIATAGLATPCYIWALAQCGLGIADDCFGASVGDAPCIASISDVPISAAMGGVNPMNAAGLVMDCVKPERICKLLPATTPCDPNEIEGPVGAGDTLVRWVSAFEQLDYTIHFENDSTLASTSAQRVEVRLPIHEKLNIGSVRLGSFGFRNMIFQVPAGLNTYTTVLDLEDTLGYNVQVTAGINVSTQELFWFMQTIDPITGAAPLNPEAGFLPINDTLGNGQGFVSYFITPYDDVISGDTVSAQANIVFDINEPIFTNTWFNTLDAGYPVSALNPLPSITDSTGIELSWTAADDPSGSGLNHVNIYYQINAGIFELLAGGLTGSNYSFTGVQGNTYGFFAQAVDSVENMELLKEVAEWSVTIGQTDTISIIGLIDSTLCLSQSVQVLWQTSADSLVLTITDTSSLVLYEQTLDGAIGTFSYGLPDAWAPGIYTLTLSAKFSNNISESITFEIFPYPVADIEGFVETCSNQTVDLTASGGVLYHWSTGDETSAITVAPQTTQTYTVTVVSSAGCSSSATHMITLVPAVTWYLDADGDTYGNPEVSLTLCEEPDGYVPDSTDCDDSNTEINPGTLWYLDADADFYYTGTGMEQCLSPGSGYSNSGLIGGNDCNDASSNVNPAAIELCNDVDDNCNGETDENLYLTFYQDNDGDTYGNAEIFELACAPSEGYVSDSTDCDDTNPVLNPGLFWYYDPDNDYFTSGPAVIQCESPGLGYTYADSAPGDCNQDNAAINPLASELCDAIDNNCNDLIDEGLPATTWYADTDDDSFGNPNASISTCTTPDGYVANSGDCDDTNPEIYTGAPEFCNDIDEDCDGITQEGTNLCVNPGIPVISNIACSTAMLTWADPGCAQAYQIMWRDINVLPIVWMYSPVITDTTYTITGLNPTKSYRTRVRKRCNASTWVFSSFQDFATTPSYFADSDGDGYGDASNFYCGDIPPMNYVTNSTDCDDNLATSNPDAPELCDNGQDDNCNGLTDEGDAICLPASNFSAENITCASATLSWTPNSCVQKYRVQWRKNVLPQQWSFKTLNNINTHTPTGLSPNTTYLWRHRSYCSGVFTDQGPFQFTTLPLTEGCAGGLPGESLVINSDLYLYPNPASNELFIELSNINTESAALLLLDATGRAIDNRIILEADQGTYKLNTAILPSGLYFVRVITADAHMYMAPFIKK